MPLQSIHSSPLVLLKVLEARLPIVVAVGRGRLAKVFGLVEDLRFTGPFAAATGDFAFEVEKSGFPVLS